MSGSTSYTVNIKALFDAGDALNKIKNIQTVLNNLKLPDNLRTNLDSSFKNLDKALQDFQNRSERGIKTKADATGITRSFDTVVKEFENIDKIVTKIKAEMGDSIDISNFINIDPNVKKKLEDINKQITELQNKINNVNTSKLKEIENVFGKLKTEKSKEKIGEALDIFKNAKDIKDIEKAIQLIEQAKKSYTGLFKTEENKGVEGTAHQIIGVYDQIIGKLKDARTEVQGFQSEIGEQQAKGVEVAAEATQKLNTEWNEATTGIHNYNNELQKTAPEMRDLVSAQQDFNSQVDQVKHRIQYFFGLANSINLVKRAIRSAFETVKELDKAMTETAVVTNYTIKDMWKQLPEYTKRANQLGVTTKEAYESATLYYQQGLNTEQAAALSTETLKMARIAGLDAADATDRMTNALRGFNMELNATQAQRVDDVYSQLAAMSASNVDEISTAMTKVASLANNANMEFETTAAFLAQIIETTRESAETAGTALKTVVARFSEVKKLVDADQLKGQDEEGQVIDVNKVSQALRTAGIDLNKYFLGEVGLDDIFMELASKWDSLTNIQQRYIATQAAGSRQQSRFIALMADYKRTQELVGAAYDSNGASEKQFEKTQDSMQSKLARLKNAWDEFAMGLANNAVLKGVVDALTTLLQIINKLTSAFGNGVGSVLKWTAAISALSGVRKLFVGGGFVDKALGTVLNGTIFGKGLFEKGILSGFLFGGKHVAGSKAQEILQEQTANGGGGTTIRTGGLFRNLFGARKERREKWAEAFDAYSIAKEDFSPGELDPSLMSELEGNLPLIGKIGTKVTNSKLLGGVSKKLAGTKFASGLSKLLGFGGSSAGAAAAAGLATALGAVATAAAAAYGAYKLWEHFSPEGQLKQATEFSKAMDQAAESAKKAKESTKEVYDTYTEKDKAVNEATTITGRNKAIEDRNTYVNELLQQNDSYAKYLKTTFKDGQLQLTLDENALKNVADEAEKAATQAAFGADLAKAMQANKQANVYRADIRRAGANIEAGTIRDYDEKNAAYQRQMTEKELAKYTNLEVKATERDAVTKGFAKSAFSKMVDGETLGGELGELVTGALTETFDANKYYNAVNSSEGGRGWSWLRRRSVWQQKYQEAYGVEADSSMKTADIARAVAQKTAQDQQQDRADTLSELVKSNKEAYEPLLKAINGDFSGKITLETDIDSFVADLTDGLNLEAFANVIGKTVPELETILKSNIKSQKEIQANQLSGLAVKGRRVGVSQGFFDKLSKMNPDQVADLFGFADAAEKSLGDGFTSFLDNLDVSQLSAYKEFFSGFNLDEPLQAVKKLNKAIKDDTNPTIQALAKDIKKANQPLFDTGYLTQFFMTSDAYEDISESLEKFIEDNEEITADNIEELAKSCSDLKTLLDETDANAQGLARAFTAVASGEASIDGITSAVLETLGATQSANTAIDKLFKTIDEFDAGRDFGKAVDFAMSKIEELEKSLENLDFGNETFKKNYEYFFTDKDYKNFIAKDTAGRKAMLEGQINQIKDLLDNDALGAMRKLASINGSGVTGDINGFDFTWDVQNWTWDDAVGKIQEYLNVNEQVASTILTAAAKHIPGLTEQLDLNGFEKDIKTFNEKISQQAVVTEQELQVLAQAYGKSVEEIWDALESSAKKNGIELPAHVKWQDDKGNNLTGDQLITAFNEQISNKKIASIKLSSLIDVKEGDTTYDPDKMLQTLMNDYKMSIAQAKTIANDLIKDTGSYFEKIIQVPEQVEKNGQKVWDLVDKKVTGKTIDEIEAKVKLEEDKAQWTAYGQAIADTIGNITINTETDEANLASERAKIVAALGGAISVPVIAKPQPNGSGSSETNNSTDTEAAGGYVSYAAGTRHIKPSVALTGEEGPELVWNKQGGYAYLVGKNGPEFADLVPGDQVFPADETKKIINRGVTPSLAKGGKVVPAYDGGRPGSWKDSNGGKGNGDGSGDKDDEFKMDLDKYYNMVEDINELLRLRNLLEKDYNQLLKTEGKTGKEIYDNLNRQLKLLEERSKIVADLAEKRKQQIIDEVAANQEYQKYAWWNNEDLTIEIDWDLVTSITDKDEGGKVKDYLSKLEDFQSKYDDMIEQLEEIEDTIQDIRERGKDQYNTLEERVRDALIKQIQDKIDELQDVDKAINDTNQKLFDSMQETLSMQRQQRDNAKTEEGLTDKEKRLAYLQQDSSNANAREIAKLQEELADERQNYTDTLIDQKISELQQQNDQAQEQRQEQIDLMQRSLDWQEKSGAFWDTVYQYISEGTDAIGALVKQSELERLLMSAEPWDKLSEEQKLNWVNDLMDQVAQGIAYLELSRQLEDIGTKEGTSISFTNANGQTLTGKVDKNGNVVVTNSDGSTITYKDVFQDYHGAYRTFETSGEVKAAPKPTVSTSKPITGTSSPAAGAPGQGTPKTPQRTVDPSWTTNETYHWHKVFYDGKESTEKDSCGIHEWGYVPGAPSDIRRCSVCGRTKTVSTKPGGETSSGRVAFSSGVTPSTRVMLRYASGGLNTQAGPAWLDGTASNPELVLNARDTQNFIELKDVLADMRKNGGFSLTGGDNYYNISVNVDQMSSDYDVDRAIDRIKARIAQDGAYRNVNTLSRLR